MDMAKTQATQRYRQQQIGLEERRMSLMEEKAEEESALKERRLEFEEKKFEATEDYRTETAGREFLKTMDDIENRQKTLDLRSDELKELKRHNLAKEKVATTKAERLKIAEEKNLLKAESEKLKAETSRLKEQSMALERKGKDRRAEEKLPHEIAEIKSRTIKNRAQPFTDSIKRMHETEMEMRKTLPELQKQKRNALKIMGDNPFKEGTEPSDVYKMAKEEFDEAQDQIRNTKYSIEQSRNKKGKLTDLRGRVIGEDSDSYAKGIRLLTERGDLKYTQAAGLIDKIKTTDNESDLRTITEDFRKKGVFNTRDPKYSRELVDYLTKLLRQRQRIIKGLR
jgi:hypothetical protein